ncbi:hypothetical protein EYF80_047808 [Liparis tanakae]|uniref:Uncharacterized protein n=1 Tax=Liparis tanakae TaxID=230148 RepID=A0A4Z2FMK6_9TELE|nr:hypothetical protein EYF80_047808 [Liparis tanakae]
MESLETSTIHQEMEAERRSGRSLNSGRSPSRAAAQLPGVHITGTQVRMRENNPQCVLPLVFLRAFAYLTDLMLIVSTAARHYNMSFCLYESCEHVSRAVEPGVCAHIGTNVTKKSAADAAGIKGAAELEGEEK